MKTQKLKGEQVQPLLEKLIADKTPVLVEHEDAGPRRIVFGDPARPSLILTKEYYGSTFDAHVIATRTESRLRGVLAGTSMEVTTDWCDPASIAVMSREPQFAGYTREDRIVPE